MDYAVILVYSTTHALQIEKLLTERGMDCKMIPVPRHLSSDCGVCVRVCRTDLASAQEMVAKSGIEHEGFYTI